jgi:hypothetical protein
VLPRLWEAGLKECRSVGAEPSALVVTLAQYASLVQQLSADIPTFYYCSKAAPVSDEAAHLLKLDCEGGEWNILKDTEAMQRVASLTMKYHLTGSKSIEDLLAILRDIRFHIDFIHRDGDKNGRTHTRRH